MKNRYLKIASLAMSLVLTVGLLAGCAPKQEAAAPEAAAAEGSKLSGNVTVVGSTSVTPLAEELGQVFQESNPDLFIEVQGVGSSAGIKAVNEGTADIGMSSRNLKEAEKAFGLTEHVIAYDGIVVAVHPSNGVTNLTSDQVVAIFKGEVKNWKEVGGADLPILVVTREAGSGTRGAFEELLKLEEEKDGNKVSMIVADALVADGNGAVKANIASKEGSVGYLSLDYADETVKMTQIDGITPSAETVKDGSFKISRPFLMLTKGEITPEAKAYLDFILSDAGQTVVSEHAITVK